MAEGLGIDKDRPKEAATVAVKMLKGKPTEGSAEGRGGARAGIIGYWWLLSDGEGGGGGLCRYGLT